MKLIVPLLMLLALVTARAAQKPNILFIIADDIGYGDVQCLNPERGKIKTPQLDKVASQGMTFTDAHSGSSVCSPNAGKDSVSILPVLLGKDTVPLHEAMVQHSITGRFTIRQGRWKLALCPGSGGWRKPGDSEAEQRGLASVQLYDLRSDIAESNNLQAEHPDVVGHLTRLIERYIANGRSTPGEPQTNDTSIILVKD